MVKVLQNAFCFYSAFLSLNDLDDVILVCELLTVRLIVADWEVLVLKNFLVYCADFLTSKRQGIVEIENLTVRLITADWVVLVLKNERSGSCADFLIVNCHVVVHIPIFL